MLRYLVLIARYLNASYRIVLFLWLLYVLIHQFKHRRELVQYARVGMKRR